MKYVGEFTSIDSRDYRIEIETNTGDGERALKLSGTPFVSSVKADGKHVYAPVRCGGATVGVLSESVLFNLYASEARGVSVRLYEGDRTVWTGYVAPTAYDQNFDAEYEVVELDCVDGIAVLKDIPFRMEGEHRVMTFGEIIFKCLKESGCYSRLYVSDNVQLSLNGTANPLEVFRISSRNFESGRKSVDQTDDDVAWSCYEVLYEICQWLGYTLMTEGDAVYMVDYDAIKAADGTGASMFRHSLGGEALGAGAKTTLAARKVIKGEDYASSGTKVSLDAVYNKVSVKDEFNTYDDLFPQFGDVDQETNLTSGEEEPGVFDRVLWTLPAGIDPGITENTKATVFQVSGGSKDDAPVELWMFRFYDSPVFTFHKYQNAAGQNDITSDSSKWGEGKFTYANYLATNGGFYLRVLNAQLTRGDMWKDALEPMEWWERFVKITGRSDFKRSDLTPLIVLRNMGEYRIGPGDGRNFNTETDNDATKQKPFVTLKDTYNSSIFGGRNHIIRIKGSFRYHDLDHAPFPFTSKLDSIPFDGDKKYANQGYIWCKVKWGSQYWDGEDWTETDTWFKLYFWDQEEHPDNWKNHDIYNQDFQFCPNKLSFMTLGEEGYIIPAPQEGNLQGDAQVWFSPRDMFGNSRRGHWTPGGSKTDNYYSRSFCGYTFIKDLSITAEVSPGLLSDADLESDTVYTNVVNEGAVDPMDEITFKVCTDDQKKPSYSSVDYLENGLSSFVTATVNKALVSKERGTEGCDGATSALRQEEHAVFKLATHYSSPKLIMEANLHNDGDPLYCLYLDTTLSGRQMIVTDREIDFRFNTVNLKLTQL